MSDCYCFCKVFDVAGIEWGWIWSEIDGVDIAVGVLYLVCIYGVLLVS
jgi:hypothetical protein